MTDGEWTHLMASCADYRSDNMSAPASHTLNATRAPVTLDHATTSIVTEIETETETEIVIAIATVIDRATIRAATVDPSLPLRQDSSMQVLRKLKLHSTSC